MATTGNNYGTSTAPFNTSPASGTVPAPYTMAPPPLQVEGYPRYVRDELSKLQKTIAALTALVPQAANKAPEAPIECMIRFAKAPWRPAAGQTADAWVTYVGGTWVYL